MIKKTIVYNDLDGNSVTEDLYFNISKADLAELDFGQTGDAGEYLQNVLKSQDQALILRTFKAILIAGVGRREGKRFVKSQEIIDDFVQTDAYSTLVIELLSNPNSVVEFFVGMFPSDLSSQLNMDEIMAEAATVKKPETVELPPAPVEKKVENYTEAELREMPLADFEKLVSYDIANLPKNILVLAMQRRAALK